MKASRFPEAQKAFVLKQGDEGTPVAEICRKASISQATYFNWKKRYGVLQRKFAIPFFGDPCKPYHLHRSG